MMEFEFRSFGGEQSFKEGGVGFSRKSGHQTGNSLNNKQRADNGPFSYVNT
jgi:hypothetical protein